MSILWIGVVIYYTGTVLSVGNETTAPKDYFAPLLAELMDDDNLVCCPRPPRPFPAFCSRSLYEFI